MVNAALVALSLVAQAQEPKRTTSLTGEIHHVKGFHSQVLKNDRNLIVYLPPNYAKETNRRYPVLYVHDGQNVFDGATSYLPNREWKIDEAAESLIRAGLIEPIIIVGIDNAGVDRANEYLPTQIKMGSNQFGGRADAYGRMLIEEIKPMIDRQYRTKPGARDTGLMGSSFGGVITLTLGLRNPNVFSRLGVVSPSIWVDNRVLVKYVQALPRKLPLKIWMDMGTREGDQATKDAMAMVKALEAKGWRQPKDFVYYEDGFAEHNEDAWARRTPAILMYLFGKR